MNLDKVIKITVCADGFVSVRWADLKPRLGAGLPCYSTEWVEEALDLIKKVCKLEVCTGKKSTTVEYRAPNWDVNQSIEQIETLTKLFEEAEKELR